SRAMSRARPMRACSASRPISTSAVHDELEQRAVGVAEVHARAVAAGSGALDRAELDLHAVLREVRDRVLDRAVPAEAEIAVARAHRIARHRRTVDAGAVEVELLV